MEKKIQRLEAEITMIKERNLRVEADKAWETSAVRIFSITIVTYVIAVLVMYFIGVRNYILNALVPTVGFFLSVQSFPAIKRWWIKRFLRRKET